MFLSQAKEMVAIDKVTGQAYKTIELQEQKKQKRKSLPHNENAQRHRQLCH
jgi:hypothetical protein